MPRVTLPLRFTVDDLTGEPTRALIARHLAGMRSHSPPESVHAFDVDKLRQPDVTFWTVWLDDEIVGCGALKRLDDERGEIKSMRVADAFLGRGIGRAILEHLIADARKHGMRCLWLETGSTAAFLPALRLYESAGFTRCGPFDGYAEDPFSVFMTRQIESASARLRDPAWRGLTVALLLNITFVAFESLAVGTVLPRVSDDLGGISLYGWVFSAFFLANMVGIVTAGELADRRRPVIPFLIGLALFSLGLLAGGLAPTMLVLVLARAVQGFGAAAVPTIAYVTIGRSYPEILRPRMFAMLSTAWILPGVAGPVVAALVADQVGWRWVFLGLLPLVLVAGGLAARSLSVLPARASASRARARIVPALGVAIGSTALLAGLGAGDPLPAVALISGGAVLAAPSLARLLPAGTLRARGALPSAVLLRGVLTFAFFAADVFVPLTVATLRGAGLALAGIALTAGTLSWSAGTWTQERTVLRVGPAPVVRNGFALIVIGVAALTGVLLSDVPVWLAVPSFAITGLGMGMAYSSISLTVLRHAPAGREGASSAAMQLTDVLGQAFGPGIGGVAVALAVSRALPVADGVAVAFALAAAMAVLGVALAGRLR